MSSSSTPAAAAIESSSPARTTELLTSLSEIRARVSEATSFSTPPPTLIAVSKYKPASDILTCYEQGQQIHFGENYVQELEDKAKLLPREIQWHFIGTLQSNKAKVLAAIPNLHTIQTLTSTKTASLLQKALSKERAAPLEVFIQVNTSGEENKSGLPPVSPSSDAAVGESELGKLAVYIVRECPGLRLVGVMTIGAIARSLESSSGKENEDFETLKESGQVLGEYLHGEVGQEESKWGKNGRLLLSMGMSSDFEAALKAGSDVVRVGTGIFGARAVKS